MIKPRKVYKSYVDKRAYPVNLQPKDIHLFSEDFKKIIKEIEVYLLNNTYLVNQIIYTAYPPFVLTKYTKNQKPSLFNVFFNLAGFRKKKIILEKAILIVDDHSIAYFHWMIETLPRLVAADSLVEKPNDFPLLLPDYMKKAPYTIESLKFLKRQVVFYNSKYFVFVKNLIVADRVMENGNCHKDLVIPLSEKFIPTSVKPSKKIYISRSKAKKRNISNEKELLPILIEYGYSIVNLEDFQFNEQVEFINQAKVLIGQHGAGLSNMIFMPKGGIVCELKKDGDPTHNHFYNLCSHLQHQYYYLLNKGDHETTHYANLWVSPPHFRSLLEEIENSLS